MSSELQRRKATAKDLFERFGEGSKGGDGGAEGGGGAFPTPPIVPAEWVEGQGGEGKAAEEGAEEGAELSAGEREGMVLAGLQRLCAAMHLGFSPADVVLIAQAADSEGTGVIGQAQFAAFFGLPLEADPMALDKGKADEEDEGPKTWMCSACGTENLTFDLMCTNW